MNTPGSPDAKVLQNRGMEAAIRAGVIIILIAWCFQIVLPFIQPIAWGMIIAVATLGVYQRIQGTVGGRNRLAAVLYILLAFLLLLAPALMLAGTLVDGVGALAENLRDDGTLEIPPPPATVAEWPVIGEGLHELWQNASTNLVSALNDDIVAPYLRGIGTWLLSNAAGVGLALLQFIISIIIAGALLAHAEGGERLAHSVATRLAGDRGKEFADLVTSTVRSVARGVLGVALIQAILAGIGFLAVGLPAAGLWALIILFSAVIQLPTSLVLAPIVIYVFATTGMAAADGSAMTTMTAAVVFAIWSALVGVADNVLKPLLLGRGAPVPMLVIFIGVIGGFVVDGIIGLFTGAIVLSLGYKMFLAWLEGESTTD